MFRVDYEDGKAGIKIYYDERLVMIAVSEVARRMKTLSRIFYLWERDIPYFGILEKVEEFVSRSSLSVSGIRDKSVLHPSVGTLLLKKLWRNINTVYQKA